MSQINQLKASIFTKSSTNFDELALNVFRYQAANNPIYRKFLNYLGVQVETVQQIEEIPFLPIELFKQHKIMTESQEAQIIFQSSGTTNSTRSKHYVADLDLYEQSFLKGFQKFNGLPSDYCILALLPSYRESSLVYMAKTLIEKSNHPSSGFYLNNYAELLETLIALEQSNQKTLLLGVTYALLDLGEQYQKLNLPDLKNTILMETGGMKGKRKEMVKSELYGIFRKNFGLKSIHSEYGMTELLSQAYGVDGLFQTPPWMKILIREINDYKSILPINRTGTINVIDLANVNSCSFIATSDLGRETNNNKFKVLGRIDNSDIRGCNLMISS